jgi:hypothetical protein
MNQMKKLIALFLFLTSIPVFSQEEKEQKEKPVEIKLSGFILNNIFYDTRKNVEALDGMVLLFPLPKDTLNALGEDMNAVPNLNLLSFASRLRTTISGPDAFGAITTGFIEFDFTSRANSASVRFRQAWLKFNWGRTELLAGRTWHPMASTDVVPSVNALSWGAPFQPFNRSDQLTVVQKINKISISASAIFQNDYVNNGPSGRFSSYQTNAIVPNIHVQAKYKSDDIIFGFGLDYKQLKPKSFTVSPTTGIRYKTNAVVHCPAILAFAQIKAGKLTVSSKTIIADNASENLMAGAFGISKLDTLTGREDYTPYRHWFIWGNATYGGKFKVGLFGGYFKNLGASDNIISLGAISSVFGLGERISDMIRIVPMCSYTSGKVMVATEIEHNIAAYGTIDYADKGKIKDSDKVSSTRILLALYYFF